MNLEKKIVEVAERETPHELWRQLYPRIYTSSPRCGNFASAKMPAALFATSRKMEHTSTQWIQPILLRLLQYDMPAIWLSKEITDAMKATTPQIDLDLLTMELPFPALTIMLPHGALQSPTDGPIRFISYARYDDGEEMFTKVMGSDKPADWCAIKGGGFFFVTCASNAVIQTSSISAKTSKLNPAAMEKWDKMFDAATVVRSNDDEDGDFQRDIHQKALFFIVSTILMMTARPDLVTEGQMQNSVPHPRGGKKEFWTPRVLGLDYQVRRDPTAPARGSHSSPRLHWVRGFWRNQPYGHRWNKKYRLLWIEPFMRGGAEAQA